MVGLGVQRSRRSSRAGEEEAAGVRCERESHGMGVARLERNDECRGRPGDGEETGNRTLRRHTRAEEGFT